MKTLSPLKAIRAKCLECAGRPSEVRKCEVTDCPLFIYRFGRNPNRRGIGVRGNLNSFKNRLLSGQILSGKGIVVAGAKEVSHG